MYHSQSRQPGSLAPNHFEPRDTVSPIPIIDLFAGPGGLNEGFSRLGEDTNEAVFETIASFEMESTAVRTLILRATYRELFRSPDGVPPSYYRFITGDIDLETFRSDSRVSQAYEKASKHVHQVELGSDDDPSHELIAASLKSANIEKGQKPWVLIGGPPCQAYSLAGRSRRAHDETFADDKKHFLYREYLNIIREFAPPVFVMENVKGLLSSINGGQGMFALIKRDLEHPDGIDGDLHYEIHSVVSDKEPSKLLPRDFIIQAEDYGVPQKRHRVILLGIRKDFVDHDGVVGRLVKVSRPVTVGDALEGIPPVRSGVSPARIDSDEEWDRIRSEVVKTYGGSATTPAPKTRGSRSEPRSGTADGAFGDWVIDDRLEHIIQHEARTHMIEDLKRYWYAATKAAENNVSLKLSAFPPELQPNHSNASAEHRPFEDRFRVQVENKPSTTVVSHISKDGHYYIHPDPNQMRSLTVREAARLQSFPDNYFFTGTRTQQYHQVGNAVPPLLANQIAKVVSGLLLAPKNSLSDEPG